MYTLMLSLHSAAGCVGAKTSLLIANCVPLYLISSVAGGAAVRRTSPAAAI